MLLRCLVVDSGFFSNFIVGSIVVPLFAVLVGQVLVMEFKNLNQKWRCCQFSPNSFMPRRHRRKSLPADESAK